MQEITSLDQKGLRGFGLTTGGIVVALFGFLLPWLLNHNLPVWPWFIAGILWPLALLKPTALEPVYRYWMKFGIVVGAINARIILGIVFFVIVMPFGLVMRLFGKDPMQRSADDRPSYRVVSKTNTPKDMENPF
jgi:hypothetical protein